MSNKKVLITGASSGIGESCARKFAANGYDLLLNARSTAKLEQLKKEIESNFSVNVFLIPFDVQRYDIACDTLNALPEEWKDIEVLINNAGLVYGLDKEYEAKE